MAIPDNIIQRAADCTIKQYMKCAYDGKLKVLVIEGEASEVDLQNAFDLINAEYVDLSGLYITQEFEIVGYINSLDSRIQFMRRWIELQRKFLINFDEPYVPGLKMAKRFGHNLYWDFEHPDKDAFLQRIAKIEMSEKKYELQVSRKVDELITLRKKQTTKSPTILESRKTFVSMLNRLQQARFVIDKEKTTMEDLALMVQDYRDQVEEAKTDRIKKNNSR